MNNQRPILLTGGSGFIGRSFCDYLFNKYPDREIIALVRAQCELPENVTQLVVTTWELSDLLTLLKDKDFCTIIHLAAYGVSPTCRDLNQIFLVNTLLPVLIAKLAKERNAALITAGSCSEYSIPPVNTDRIAEDAPLEEHTLYGSSKAAGWLATSASAVSLDIKYTHLRFFNVYGSKEASHRLLPSLVYALNKDQRIKLSDGEQIRDFVNIEDACAAILKAEEIPATSGAPRVINVCTGQGHSVREFAETVCSIMGKNPNLLGFGDIPRRPDDTERIVGNPAILNVILNFNCQLELRRGLNTVCRQLIK